MILVHGAWHGSWCWAPVTPHLAARGIPSIPIDLAGHGLNGKPPAARSARPFDPAALATEPSPVAAVGVRVAAEALVDGIRLAGNGEPCVVVAHSLGGVIATAAAELAPELFAHLVYLTAYAPVTASVGQLASEYHTFDRVLVADPVVVGALRLDPTNPLFRDEIRELFYGDVDVPAAEAAIALLGNDAPAQFAAEKVMVTRDRFGAVPHSYIVCVKDNAIPEPLQRRLVQDIDAVSVTATGVITLDSSHSAFLSRPEELAQVLADAEQGGGSWSR
ncbi:alpha/beta fold hydrolase [Actinoplanes sp. M2I2]|uniref:alpha/beta fold hydrolase n=1 Tax=Actinoplanes sp. M2I2 TaxID=1734444 RepID=UPI00201FBCD7|nr:alpha/beta hydrolase [Actinoplanes sp. M2I2]